MPHSTPKAQSGNRALSRTLGGAAIIAAVGLTLGAAKPAHGPGPVYIAGQVRNEKLGFTFDIPAGLQAEPGTAGGLYWIGSVHGGTPLTLWAQNQAFWFTERLANPSDTLASFARQNLGMDCDADGPDGSSHADSLISMKRFRTARGFEAVEYTVRVVDERWEGGSDDESDSAAAVSPKAVSKSVRVGGPFYIVDLGRPGKPLWVRISSGCSEPANAAAIRVARAFVNTLQRI